LVIVILFLLYVVVPIVVFVVSLFTNISIRLVIVGMDFGKNARGSPGNVELRSNFDRGKRSLLTIATASCHMQILL
jgi:hypothetical protein